MEQEQATAENQWKLTIKSLSQKKELSIPANSTVETLREAVANLFEVKIEQTCLIFGGKILKDNEHLKDHGIGANSTVHLVIRPVRSEQPKPAETRQPPESADPASNLGSRFTALGSLPFGNVNLAEMQQSIAQALRNDPNAMQHILNNPMVQGLMNNPEVLRSLMLSNPQMQRVIEQNPEVSHLFNNPEMMRQTMEILRNPTTLQEIMRNHDRALINLESLPGGYNALQRIYRDVQEPMINATQEQFGFNPLYSNDPNRPVNTSQAGTENTDPLPNPWAPAGQPSSTGTTNTASTGNNRTDSVFSPGSMNAPWMTPQMQDLLRQAAENPRLLSNIFRSPHISPLLDSYAQDPQLLRELIMANPLARNNPQLREQMLRAIPAFISQWSSNEVRELYSNQEALSAILQIQQGILRLQNAAPEFARRLTAVNFDALMTPPAEQHSASTDTPTAEQQPASEPPSARQEESVSPGPAPSAEGQRDSAQDYTTALFQLLNLLTPPADQQPQQPPEQRYAAELDQMQMMGFHNREANLQALIASMGDVNLAVERILEQQQRQNFNPPRS